MFKKNKSAATLIVGSDSFIGRALMAKLQQNKAMIWGTTRRREAVDESHLYLDLAENVDNWQCPWPIDVAVVCVGITKLQDCRRDPISSRRVNVKGISALVKNLVGKGVFVVYLSTNQIFDGSKPYRLANDPRSPITEYGRQKAEAERRISQWINSVAIIRFTKVLGQGTVLFSEWKKSLKKGEVIHPFNDMFMAPLPLSFAVSVLCLIIERRLSGILQVSGGYDVSYTQVAYRGTELLDVDQRLVQAIESVQADQDAEPNPAHTTLNVDRLKSVLGIEPPDVWWTIDKAFVQADALDRPTKTKKCSV